MIPVGQFKEAKIFRNYRLAKRHHLFFPSLSSVKGFRISSAACNLKASTVYWLKASYVYSLIYILELIKMFFKLFAGHLQARRAKNALKNLPLILMAGFWILVS